MSGMNKDFFGLTFSLLLLFTGFSIHPAKAQTEKQAEKEALYAEILHMDSLLFDAFNTRNLDAMKDFFTTDLEVYQDNVGLRNYDQTINAFKELFAKSYILQRALIQSSLEVFPVKDYGAIQTGRHTFCHTENGKRQCGTFRFVHVWEKIKDRWKIKRLITYDH